MKDLALPTPAADSPPPLPFTDDQVKTDALVAKIRALVLAEMQPAGLVPDRVTIYAIDSHIEDALAWVDVALTAQVDMEAEGYQLDADGELVPAPRAEADPDELTR